MNIILTGTSADGSDATPAQGMYESACGRYWSNQPYSRAENRRLLNDLRKQQERERKQKLKLKT